MRVIKKKIAVKKLESAQTTESGLHLPPTATQDQCISGEVVACGTKVDLMHLHIGDIVHFNRFVAQTIKFDGEEYYILSEDDILAIE